MKPTDFCRCLLYLAGAGFLAYGARFFEATREIALDLPARVDSRAAAIEKDLVAQLADWRLTTESQASGTRGDVRAIARLLDARTGEALQIVRTGVADADIQLTGIRTDLDGQLLATNTTLATTAWPLGELARRYTLLPDQIAADRETKGLIAETMGVLGATKVTMGQAAKTAKVIADEAPKMTEHVEQITTDITREADALTQPQTFWGQFRTWLLTIARIYGAI